MKNSLERLISKSIVASLLALSISSTSDAQRYSKVSDLVRKAPYNYIDHNVFENWEQARTWVLRHEGDCSRADRKGHIFVNLNGEIVTWIENILDRDGETDSRKTIRRINGTRGDLEREGKSSVVIPSRGYGYPFAYSCELAQDVVEGAVESYFNDTLSGSWNGIRIRSDNKLTIRETFAYVNEQKDYGIPESITERLLGQFIIESGGNKEARSFRGARGILQLMPDVMNDCNIPQRYATHRIAQIDCALRTLRIKYNVLQPRVNDTFYNVPEDKRQVLLEWLTTQAYHAGVGNISKLMGYQNGDGSVARELNDNYHEKYTQFSGEDLALFLIGHNYGRANMGPQALKYGVDASIGLDILQKYKQDHGIE